MLSQEIPLSDAPLKRAMIVVRISGENKQQLRQIGIVRGSDIRVLRHVENSPWVIQVQDAKIALDSKLVACLWVRPHET